MLINKTDMEDYVTFEQAQRLKELGFDWECFFPYTDGKIVRNHPCPINWNNHGYTGYELISAPTLSQAQKWLREKKGIILYLEPGFYKGKKPLMGYDYHLSNKDNGMYSHIESETIYDTYEQAFSAGIDKALELLK